MAPGRELGVRFQLLGIHSGTIFFSSRSQGLAPLAYWTVTLPAVESDFDAVPIVEAPLSTEPLPLAYEEVDPDKNGSDGPPDGLLLRYVGRYTDRKIEPDTDVAVAFSGRIAITRLSLSGPTST